MFSVCDQVTNILLVNQTAPLCCCIPGKVDTVHGTCTAEEELKCSLLSPSKQAESVCSQNSQGAFNSTGPLPDSCSAFFTPQMVLQLKVQHIAKCACIQA